MASEILLSESGYTTLDKYWFMTDVKTLNAKGISIVLVTCRELFSTAES